MQSQELKAHTFEQRAGAKSFMQLGCLRFSHLALSLAVPKDPADVRMWDCQINAWGLDFLSLSYLELEPLLSEGIDATGGIYRDTV